MEDNFKASTTLASNLLQGLEQVIKGQTHTIKLIIAALLADGHVLIEDYPGSGKTTLAKTLGKLIGDKDGGADSENIVPFRRIQFTPDMLPGDVLGVNMFNPKEATFSFLTGPVFAHIVLADEINRAGPKVQSAFLECMAEKQVTIDNISHPLHNVFFVIGTQNPLDFAGTYPLPFVQLDRFMIKIPMSYVDEETEKEILKGHYSKLEKMTSIDSVCTVNDIIQARKDVTDVFIHDAVRETIIKIIRATRETKDVDFGVSTRAGIMLEAMTRAWALVEGRSYCTDTDLKQVIEYVLLHRMRFVGSSDSPSNILSKIVTPHIESLVKKSGGLFSE